MLTGFLIETTNGDSQTSSFEVINPHVTGHYQKRRNFGITRGSVTIFRFEFAYNAQEAFDVQKPSIIEQIYNFINTELDVEPVQVKISYYEVPPVYDTATGDEIELDPEDINLFESNYLVYNFVNYLEVSTLGYDVTPFAEEIVESVSLQLVAGGSD